MNYQHSTVQLLRFPKYYKLLFISENYDSKRPQRNNEIMMDNNELSKKIKNISLSKMFNSIFENM